MKIRNISQRWVRNTMIGMAMASMLLLACGGSGSKGGSGGGASSSANEFTSFSIVNPPVNGVISGDTISITVPYGTDVENLIPKFSIKGEMVRIGTEIQTSEGNVVDFSSPRVYLVVARNGAVRQYTVTVTEDLNHAKDIIAFSLGSPVIATGVISGTNITAVVPYNTTLSNLVANFSHTGDVVRVNGIEQVSGTTANNFSSAVNYVVTAANGTTKTYRVTVTVASANQKSIDSYSILGIPGVITGTNIAVTVPAGYAVSSLIAQFTYRGASIKVGATDQSSGVTVNNFTSPVTYEVTAGDSTTVSYTVTVTQAAGGCGDGYVDASGEQCDGNNLGTGGETASCNANCTLHRIGDEIVNKTAGEECDFGIYNAVALSGCSPLGKRPNKDSAEAGAGDNTYETAKTLPLNGTKVSGRTIDINTDIDWFKFTVAANTTYNFALSDAACVPYDKKRLQLALYDTNGEDEIIKERELGSDDTLGKRCAELSYHFTSAGTYYIMVDGYTNSGYNRTFAYSITAKVVAPDASEASGGNNTLATATLINANGTTLQRSLHAPGDVDFYKLVSNGATGSFHITVDSPSTVNSDYRPDNDLRLQILDNEGNEISNHSQENGWDGDAAIVASVARGANDNIFYARVYSNDGDVIHPEYSITFRTVLPDSREPNNSFATASLVSVNSNVSNLTLHDDNDVDWFQFNVTSTSKFYKIQPVSSECLKRDARGMELTLYDGDEAELRFEGYEHNGRANPVCPMIVHKFSQTGVYYVKLVAKTGSYSSKSKVYANYTMTVRDDFVPQPADATEPDNNLIANAYDVTSRFGQIITGYNTHRPQDVDFFKFTLTQRSRVLIETFGCIAEPYDGRGLSLMLYSDEKITYNNSGPWDYEIVRAMENENKANRTCPAISRELNAGTYPFGVFELAWTMDDIGPDYIGPLVTGPYNLRVTVTPVD